MDQFTRRRRYFNIQTLNSKTCPQCTIREVILQVAMKCDTLLPHLPAQTTQPPPDLSHNTTMLGWSAAAADRVRLRGKSRAREWCNKDSS